MSLQLVIGNKTYSSWSLRAWLYLKKSQIEFEEIKISLYSGTWRDEIRRYSPAGRVPVLVDNGFPIWDSLAIIAYVLERYPTAIGWPSDAQARARAQSISAEMHSGFLAVREGLPQNLKRRERREMTGEIRRGVDRICEIWRDCRSRYADASPWLFGDFSVADVMYAPVALRFLSYEVQLGAVEADYAASIQALPEIQQWISEAKAETQTIAIFDDLERLASSPFSLG